MLSIILTEGIIFYSEFYLIFFAHCHCTETRSACYASLKNWQKAFEDALTCISKDAKFVKGYYRLSSAQTELGMYDDAETTLKAALALEPGALFFEQVLNCNFVKDSPG